MISLPLARIEPPPSVPSQKERMTSKLSSASLTNGDRKPGADPVGSPIKEEEDPIDNWASMGLVKTGTRLSRASCLTVDHNGDDPLVPL